MKELNNLAYQFMMTERNSLGKATAMELKNWLIAKGIESYNWPQTILKFRNQSFTRDEYRDIFQRWVKDYTWREYKNLDPIYEDLKALMPNMICQLEMSSILHELGIEKRDISSRRCIRRYQCDVLFPDQLDGNY